MKQGLKKAPTHLANVEEPKARLNLLYDSKCAVCQWEVDNLQWLGSGDKISFTDIESLDYDENDPLNANVSYRQGMERIHAVTADGEIVSGIAVFARCYEEVGFGWLFQPTRAPVIGPLLSAAYDAFATVRTLLTRNGKSVDALVEEREARQQGRSRQPRMMAGHSPADLQLAAALVFPLLAYKASAIVQRVQLQWYLDASIALAAVALVVYASSSST